MIKSFDRVAHIYDETRAMPPDVENAIADGIAALVRGLGAPARLLEVGIGTGRIAVPMAERGVRITGIDVSPKMLARLREKRGDIDVLFAEAGRLPFRDGSFDAALFVHVLHLVPDIEATIAAAMAAVRPGGAVLFGGEGPRVGRETELSDALDRIINRHIDVRDPEVRDMHGRRKSAEMVEARGGTVEQVPLALHDVGPRGARPAAGEGPLRHVAHPGRGDPEDRRGGRAHAGGDAGRAGRAGGLRALVQRHRRTAAGLTRPSSWPFLDHVRARPIQWAHN